MTRLTRCWRAVDTTDAEQKASHKLREAAFCGRCSKGKMADDVVAYCQNGKRRHWTAA